MAEPATLVDTNVLIDILTEDETWFVWSSTALGTALREGRLVINPVIYAEVSVRFADYETCDATLSEKVFAREPLPWEGSFLAGKAFQRYKQRGGTKTSPLATSASGRTQLSPGCSC
ncbi:type II toxin-antitoxin system VapC family toxin [Sciscionella marina]|uniref:type II toxin-antitoxin system VapC family toxin n=1 Tax=Sciscionella marina TaxID=508770 RepID=UPI0003A05ABC|nr:hypothetical protein [Sciscionella marina]